MRDKRRLVEWGKNVVIALLAVSALLLLQQTQFYSGAGESGSGPVHVLLSLLSGEEEEYQAAGVDWRRGTAIPPVRLAVMSSQGRAGFQYDNEEVLRLFTNFSNPLVAALTAAEPPVTSSAEEFQAALQSRNPGIYLDFLGVVPLPNLTAWLSGVQSLEGELNDMVRRLLLTVTDEGEVMLYYIDEDTGLYYSSRTSPELSARLERLVGSAPQPNGVQFAFEAGEEYADLDPYTMLEGGAAPRPSRYTVSNPVPLTGENAGDGYGEAFESLVSRLSFHPQSMSYPSRDNSVVVQEGSERLRIYSNGQVIYDPTEADVERYPIQGSGDDPTLWELVGGAWSFVDGVLSDLCGAARLYIMDVEVPGEGQLTVRFGYQLDGAAVLVGQDGYAAQVEITGGSITAYRFQLRSYAYLDEGPAIMPEIQAAAALYALEGEGRELMRYYPDSLGDSVSAAWGGF